VNKSGFIRIGVNYIGKKILSKGNVGFYQVMKNNEIICNNTTNYDIYSLFLDNKRDQLYFKN